MLIIFHLLQLAVQTHTLKTLWQEVDYSISQFA